MVACSSDGSGGGTGDDGVTPVEDGTQLEVGFADGGVDVETIGFDTQPLDTGGTSPDGDDVPTAGFGEPCTANLDCPDGFCVEGPEGFVCTKSCDAECPSGYDCRGVQSGSADIVFLCLPRVKRVCVPCKADYQCSGGACLELGAFPQCSYQCEDDGDCPGGYACGADPGGTHPGTFCIPRSGSCDCTPDFEGAVRTCTNENAFGTCYGVETCDPNVGWVGCTAAAALAEMCDGRDNDCNALVDDGVETNVPCDNTIAGVGTCSGTRVCVGTQGYVCTAATPEVEACDFQDNDCDGETDEDFKDAAGAFTLGEHCGSCGNDCSEKIANGTGRCEVVEGASPVCVVAACDPDYVELNRFQCALPPDVSCLPCASSTSSNECYDGSCITLDGQDVCVVPCGDSGSCQEGYACQDVDGVERCVPLSASCLCNPATDGQIRTCVRSSASGTCYGQETCDADAGWLGCTAREPGDEVCNGVDDDCSSGIDDVIGRGNACTNDNSDGSCPGVRDCVEGETELQCVGPIPSAEVCNYEDDDCDGTTDEGFPNLYVSCSNGVGACQRFGFYACKADGSATECNATAGTASAELCDGLDNNCDGATDETFTDLGTVCATGEGACKGFGTRVCNTAQNGTDCTAAAGSATTETCDLVDNDCDGVTDNGFVDAGGKYTQATACGNCFTNCTVIFDRDNAFGRCNTGSATPTCEMACDPGFFDLNEVPDDGCEFELDTSAIYVGIDSRNAADDSGCGVGPYGTGTNNHPCKSISYGLQRAQSAGRSSVIVADGLYNEQVVVKSGIDILGGYRADTWDRHLSSTGTIVRGPEGSGHRKAVVASGITAATVIEGLVVNAASGTSTGANSYGIYVSNSGGGLRIRNNLVFAGLGGPGGSGTNGQSGENGVNGIPGLATKHLAGAASCTSTPNQPGGKGGEKECLDPGTINTMKLVHGGKGGDSECPAKGNQEGGGSNGLNGGGAGGPGGWGHDYDSGGCYPTPNQLETGTPGSDATVLLSRDGNGGNGASDTDGDVVGLEWQGIAGLSGQHGQHGAGGGGGGAGGGASLYTADYGYDISGSGGGGGSGGCAGWLGGGGTAGGGSFGIFVTWSAGSKPASSSDVPVISDNTISRNQGGPGGSGGNGGAGGDPGSGALGGAVIDANVTAPIYCVFGGAKGGFGARGGHGGGGGGGSGGASYDILVWGINGQTGNFSNNTFPNGGSDTGGEPGPGGNSSNTTKRGTAGAAGDSDTVHVIN